MGPLFGSPYNKSPTILGSILGPLSFGISHLEMERGFASPSWQLTCVTKLNSQRPDVHKREPEKDELL